MNHRRVFASGFIISGLFAAISGMVLTSRAALAAPGAFEPYLLDAFVAVYLGSVVVRSGRINVIGTAIGALFVGLIGNALTLMGLGCPLSICGVWDRDPRSHGNRRVAPEGLGNGA